MNSRLLNVSTILVAVLSISVGMFIYNSAQSTITDVAPSLSTQEIDAFNNQFVNYEGMQSGEEVKNFLRVLSQNAELYSNDIRKIPGMVIEPKSDSGTVQIEVFNVDDVSNYITEIDNLIDEIVDTNEYYVEFTYQDYGIINRVYISYDSTNPITNL